MVGVFYNAPRADDYLEGQRQGGVVLSSVGLRSITTRTWNTTIKQIRQNRRYRNINEI